MEHSVAGEVSKSQSIQGLEIGRTRQAHSMEWYYAKLVENQPGPEQGWQVILVVYIKYAMTGVTCLDKSYIMSATYKGYALDAARLFTLRGYPTPSKMLDQNYCPQRGKRGRYC
jgi:hypothetical protein